jgi:cobalamin synthase
VIVIDGQVTLVIVVLFMIRRLHDIDASGWYALLVLVPLVNVLLILFLLLKGGTQGTNRFGPERITRTWEKVVGIIGIVFMILGVIGIIAAMAIPAYLSLTGQLPPLGVPPH